jgi:putative endonuclease
MDPVPTRAVLVHHPSLASGELRLGKPSGESRFFQQSANRLARALIARRMPRRSSAGAKAGLGPVGKPAGELVFEYALRRSPQALAARSMPGPGAQKLPHPRVHAVIETAHASSALNDLKRRAAGIALALGSAMSGLKRFVYVVTTVTRPEAFYVGVTNDVPARLADHNAGRCAHTLKRRPWQLHVAIEFTQEATALRFERYLKSGSGRAFAKRHFSVSGDAGRTS